jgi:hypothetical protein
MCLNTFDCVFPGRAKNSASFKIEKTICTIISSRCSAKLFWTTKRCDGTIRANINAMNFILNILVCKFLSNLMCFKLDISKNLNKSYEATQEEQKNRIDFHIKKLGLIQSQTSKKSFYFDKKIIIKNLFNFLIQEEM